MTTKIEVWRESGFTEFLRGGDGFQVSWENWQEEGIVCFYDPPRPDRSLDPVELVAAKELLDGSIREVIISGRSLEIAGVLPGAAPSSDDI